MNRNSALPEMKTTILGKGETVTNPITLSLQGAQALDTEAKRIFDEVVQTAPRGAQYDLQRWSDAKQEAREMIAVLAALLASNIIIPFNEATEWGNLQPQLWMDLQSLQQVVMPGQPVRR